jgi:23S rRNA (cytosine1962-C5)-methyltransferase
VNTPAHPPLQLKRREERRIRQGHAWVYSNEIDTKLTPLKSFAPGALAELRSASGKPLALVHVNPNALICARVLTRDVADGIDREFLLRRLASALSMRERVYPEPYYRLAYGDSDGLPGLIVDRYGDYLVVQIATAGMEAMLEAVVAALIELLSPRGILLRNESAIRELEQLPLYTRIVHGDLPPLLDLCENGVRFRVSALSGQKTGWFYDHRDNRRRVAELARGRRVLDVFSYVGGWGVQAAVAGARSVLCVDSSEAALQLARDNATLNQVAERVECRTGDAFDVLHALSDGGERFDMVILDPPAFIKRRRDQESGENAYHRINRLAMRLLEDDAMLVSASCSWHLEESALIDIVRSAALHNSRTLQLLAIGGQGADHPVHPAMPETRYLKSLICRVCR